MLEFKSISASDFERYNKYRLQDSTNASEGVFMTMFIWNNYYNLELAENGEFLFIRFNIKGKEPSYFFPIGSGNIDKALTELSDYAASNGEKLCFRLVSKENKEKPIIASSTTTVVPRSSTNASVDKWVCSNCQAENSINYGQCKKCGNFRSDNKAVRELTEQEKLDGYWICKKCYTKNLVSRDTCWSCDSLR